MIQTNAAKPIEHSDQEQQEHTGVMTYPVHVYEGAASQLNDKLFYALMKRDQAECDKKLDEVRPACEDV